MGQWPGSGDAGWGVGGLVPHSSGVVRPSTDLYDLMNNTDQSLHLQPTTKHKSVCVCSVLYRPAAPPLSRSQRHPGPARTLLILLGLMEHSEGCVCQVLHLQTHRNLFISWQRTVVFMFAAFLQVSPGLFKPTAFRLLKPFSSHYMLLWMQMQK